MTNFLGVDETRPGGFPKFVDNHTRMISFRYKYDIEFRTPIIILIKSKHYIDNDSDIIWPKGTAITVLPMILNKMNGRLPQREDVPEIFFRVIFSEIIKISSSLDKRD